MPRAKDGSDCYVRVYRREALDAAEDLGYGDDVIRAIRNAKNDDEISIIMTKERKRR